jgi:hypothetical protein
MPILFRTAAIHLHLRKQSFFTILVAAALFLYGCAGNLHQTPSARQEKIIPHSDASMQESSRIILPQIEKDFSATIATPESWWMPLPGTSWQWQLSGDIDTSLDVEMYDIDLLGAPKTVIDQLHNAGRTVICYFSAGSWENWRPDAQQYPSEVLGKPLEGWQDERWVDIRQMDVLQPILSGRFDIAMQKGCDGVEADNVDAYANDSGFPLSAQDQLDFNLWLADQAHARGLSIGLKNDLDQVSDLLPYFDWALNEQCFEFDECYLLLPFIQSGKAVFGVEYNLEPDQFCPDANAMNFDWLKKNLELDSYRVACR